MEDPPRPAHLAPLSDVMPPLLLGTATFNTQYVADPAHMPYRAIVQRALVDLDVRGFDTSPYYGPSEELLGEALDAATTTSTAPIPRSSYFLETKAGRVHSSGFDYSPAAVQASVLRSLRRLRTPYVDLVYAHDVEFVSPAEVVGAVRALRAMRTTSSPSASSKQQPPLRYVGISGYPVHVLAELAELILRETGEPVDAVLSYGHCTVQNGQLAALDDNNALARFRAAGVSVVLNASLLNMGLLTTRGVDSGPLAAWHPSPRGLRLACAQAAQICQDAASTITTGVIDTSASSSTPSSSPSLSPSPSPLTPHPPYALERIALRYALDVWARAAAAARVGTSVPCGPSSSVGPSVLGVTSVGELTETVLEWWSVLDGLQIPHRSLPYAPSPGSAPGSGADSCADSCADSATAVSLAQRDASLRRTNQVAAFVHDRLWPVFGSWKDYAWSSPSPGWVNELNKQLSADGPNL